MRRQGRATSPDPRMSGGPVRTWRECSVTKTIAKYVMVVAGGDGVAAMMLKYLTNARGNRIGPQINIKHNVRNSSVDYIC